MTREEPFDPRHVSVKPQAKLALSERAAAAATAQLSCAA
jgi:hypothetical protein